MAECTKPAIPGSGVCPGQTTGRGILDDAVALVRGDRYLSYDLNSNTLTNWGYSRIGQVAPGAFGGMLPKMLFRGLPGSWTGTSAYALLPFYTPKAVQGILKGNKVLADYDITRPRSDADIVAVHTIEGCKTVFADRANFAPLYTSSVNDQGKPLLIGWNGAQKHDNRSELVNNIFFEQGIETKVSKFFGTHVASLIQKSSLKYRSSRRAVDIVRDVTNVVPILWLAERFAIPLKTAENPRGLLSTAQLFDMYIVLFLYQSYNVLPENEWALRDGTRKIAPILSQVFEGHLKTQQGFKEKIVDRLAKDTAYEVGPEADRIFHALNNTKLPLPELVGNILGMSAPVAGNITQQASLLIDLYLSEGYEQYKARIVELAHMDTPEALAELQGFVFEGMRHAGVVPGVPHVANNDTAVQDGTRGAVQVKAGTTIIAATSKASMDPAAFPEPEKLNPHRPFADYALLGDGIHVGFDSKLVGPSLTATLKEVFKLKNIRRAPGRLGRFAMIKQQVAGVDVRMYLDSHARESPVPTTLTIEYDE